MERAGLVGLLIVLAGCSSSATAPAVTRDAAMATTTSTTERAPTTAVEPSMHPTATPTSISSTNTTEAPTTTASTTTTTATTTTVPDDRIPVILDTDANNELDDQHAIAYLLASDDVFDVLGLTINRTSNGGALDLHVAEAERIVALMDADVPVIHGADGSFAEISSDLDGGAYDGQQAVEFIIDTVRAHQNGSVLLLPIGKLTNIALALERAPDIIDDVRVLWLGSNYPDPGEYNQDNDEAALQFVLDSDVRFEIALVRAGGTTGTASVLATISQIRERMPGLGPTASPPVPGRASGEFSTFGDYSIDLFERASLEGDSRALYDLAAVAIVREPSWATAIEIPAPRLVDGQWVDRPGNTRTITIWERFDRDAIIESLFDTLAMSAQRSR